MLKVEADDTFIKKDEQATTTQYGLIKIDGDTTVLNEYGQLVVNAKGDDGESAYISVFKEGRISTVVAEDSLHGVTTVEIIDGRNGITPTITISAESTWVINGIDTHLPTKEGIIQEALVETIGCSGMTHSAAMAAEILPGRTVLEALNTDLVCDAINTAMRELFLQIAYGRSQSAFSEGGLAVGAGLEDLGKGLRSQVGTMYGTLAKGPRYLEMAEGYVTGIALDKDNQIIGYKFVSLGKMTDFIKKGDDPTTAYEKACGQYGRVADAVKIIDPRTDEEIK